MTKQDRQSLKANASDALRNASYSPRKLVLIHSAISAALALLIAAASFLLELQIANTGGLGGIGSRSALETAQSLLEMLNMILLPFWQLGLVWATLSIHRGQTAEPRSLLHGFRNFGPILRGKLMQCVVLLGAAFLGCYLGILLFSFTPLSESLYTAAEPYLTAEIMDTAAMMEDEAVMAAMMMALPFMVLGMALLVVPLYYRLRLMDYILVDQPEKGAFYAMRGSKVIMRGQRWQLFKLDLNFWWFYLLEALISVVCMGDLILPLFGVDLGMSAEVAFFLFYIVGLTCQVALYAWKQPNVMTTYAGFYEHVRWGQEEPEQEPTVQVDYRYQIND